MLLLRYLLASLLCAVLLFSFSEKDVSPAPVILISVDTLRADHLSAYGYKRIRTPNLDAFAEHGTLFKAIDSQIPLTLPSHTCLFTSTYPFQNGVEENGEIVPDGLLTLASVLHSHGYRTGAFIGSDLLSQRYHLDRGFDLYDSPFHPASGEAENPYEVRVRRAAPLVLRAASQWLGAPGGQAPPFLFVHLFDLHTPYSVPSPNRIQPNVAGYDSELVYVDEVLGHFRERLVQKGWWDRSLVILLSDHGESLGDHGETSHGYFTYQSTLSVPVLVHWPANSTGLPAAVVNDPGGLIDIAPTILDFLHIQPPAAFRGVSLLQRIANRAVYSESMYPHDAFLWSPLRSLRVRGFQYIDAPKAELYDLGKDPREQQNAIQTDPSEARELRSRLRNLLAANASRRQPVARDTSPAAISSLGSLGYVAAGSAHNAAVAAGGPDPKDRLPEYQQYERGLAALYDHRELEAVAIFQDILKRDPSLTIARYYLGDAYLRVHRPADALREWKAALARDPGYEPAAEAIQKLGSRPGS